MSKPNVSKMVKTAKMWTVKHSPEILVGVGVTGMITSTVLAVKATPKALELIEQKKREDRVEDLTVFDTVKTAWKCYIPAAAVGVASMTCVICANSMNLKRNAAIAAAYKISETAFSEYKEKVIETIGEKKEKEVKDKVAKSKIEKNPASKNEVIITGGGDTLCFESISGQYFKSDIEKIRKAENIINKRMLKDNYVSLTELYSELGINQTSISDEIGWSIDNGLIELYFSSQLSDNGVPCLVISYDHMPVYDYQFFA